MNKYLTITIDVEPDCTPTWRYSDPLTFTGVTKGISEILQPLFNKYQICPTYLINNVVLEDRGSVNTFLNLKGSFELGTHLHSEFIEPDKLYSDYAGKKGEANQCFLRPDVEFEKMKNITDLFISNFKRSPTSFRAGRFSAGINTVKCLSELGYKVDTSITPHISWNDKTRAQPIDYSNAYEQPYFVKNNSYLEREDDGKILEVPVSILSARKYLFFKRPIWLRPYMSDYTNFIKVINSYSKRHCDNEHLVFNMMFHNVEVLPKMSPYPQTELESQKYLDSLESLFIYCAENNIKSVGLSDLYEIFRK